jgi:hypothetical protein
MNRNFKIIWRRRKGVKNARIWLLNLEVTCRGTPIFKVCSHVNPCFAITNGELAKPELSWILEVETLFVNSWMFCTWTHISEKYVLPKTQKVKLWISWGYNLGFYSFLFFFFIYNTLLITIIFFVLIHIIEIVCNKVFLFFFKCRRRRKKIYTGIRDPCQEKEKKEIPVLVLS